MNILMFARTVSKAGSFRGITCNHILDSIIINKHIQCLRRCSLWDVKRKLETLFLRLSYFFQLCLHFGCGSSKSTSSSQPSNKTTLSTNNNASSTTQVATVSATITVGSGPAGIAYDSGKGEMFVANHDDNTVSVISDSTNTCGCNRKSRNLAHEVGLWFRSGRGICNQ